MDSILGESKSEGLLSESQSLEPPPTLVNDARHSDGDEEIGKSKDQKIFLSWSTLLEHLINKTSLSDDALKKEEGDLSFIPQEQKGEHNPADSPRAMPIDVSSALNFIDTSPKKFMEVELVKAQVDAATTKVDALVTQLRMLRDITKLKEDLLQTKIELNKSLDQNITLQRRLLDAKTELVTRMATCKSLIKEKEGWQNQLDVMYQRLQQAERRDRCADPLTRAMLDTRHDIISGTIKRNKQDLAHLEPSKEIIGLIQSINAAILDNANVLKKHVQYDPKPAPCDEKAMARIKMVVGQKLASLLQNRTINLLLISIVLKVFMVHWCTDIIECWYPLRQTFSDLLIRLSDQSSTGQRKFGIIQTNTVRSPENTIECSHWLPDMMADLANILQLGGVEMRPSCLNLFNMKFLDLIKRAYNARTALAEKDVCGGLELSVVKPGMPFQFKWMDEANVSNRRKLLDPIEKALREIKPILGTCSLGLQRFDPRPDSSSNFSQIPIMIVKPSVVLMSSLTGPH